MRRFAVGYTGECVVAIVEDRMDHPTMECLLSAISGTTAAEATTTTLTTPTTPATLRIVSMADPERAMGLPRRMNRMPSTE